jgi:hypothetical protein
MTPQPSRSAEYDSIFFYAFRIWGLYRLMIYVSNNETAGAMPVDPYGRKRSTPRGWDPPRTASEALALRMGLDAIRTRFLNFRVSLIGT